MKRVGLTLGLLVGAVIASHGGEPVSPLEQRLQDAAIISKVTAPPPISCPIKYEPTDTPADAVCAVHARLLQLPIDAQLFVRYIWFPNGIHKAVQATNYTVNSVLSTTTSIYLGTPLCDWRLLEIDLRRLAPDDKDLDRLIQNWEEFAKQDPYFRIQRVAATKLEDLAEVEPEYTVDDYDWKLEACEPYRLQDEQGRWITYSQKWVKTGLKIGHEKPKKKVVISKAVSEFGRHVDIGKMLAIATLTHSEIPIVRFDFFNMKAWTTLNNGLYYKFLNIDGNKDAKQTDLQFFQRLIGVDQKVVENLNSEQRAGIFKSKVTARPRALEFITGSGVRPSYGSGLYTQTQDIAEENVNAATHPIRNLLNQKFDATEAIGQRPNGLQIYGIFNGVGKLAQSVPDGIAHDGTVPFPYPSRLEPGMSCLRCHGVEEGYLSAKNDVKELLSLKPGEVPLDIFDDDSDADNVRKTLDKIKSRFWGEPTEPFRNARNGMSYPVFLATHDGRAGLGMREVTRIIGQIHEDYWYTGVGPRIACYELGYKVDEKQAKDLLNQLLPPLPKNVFGFSPEDPIIHALKKGLTVGRTEWEQVYADAMLRAITEQLRRLNEARTRGIKAH